MEKVTSFKTEFLRRDEDHSEESFVNAEETSDVDMEVDVDQSRSRSREENGGITQLRDEVQALKKQVRTLKRILVMNVFENKHDMKDFFSDIW